MSVNRAINLISNFYKFVYRGFNKDSDNMNMLSNNVIDEYMTDIIVERIPSNLNFFDKRKWFKYKENLLLNDKGYKRVVMQDWCVWLYSNRKAKRWSILEKVKSLKLLVNNLSENEIWFFDDGEQKICLSLLNGNLIWFKILGEFSESALEHVIKHMKKYSFESPKVRIFGAYFDFNYDVEVFSIDKIERAIKFPISKIKYKYIQNIIENLRFGLANAVSCITLSILAFTFYSKSHGLGLKMQDLQSRMRVINKRMLNYPPLDHLKSLEHDVQRKIDLSKLVDYISNHDYKIRLISKNELSLQLINIDENKKSMISDISRKCGFARICFH
ncbi:hypothetical protein [Candidatus Cytomitobacter primus]|uniref:Uncharacterized protein n=1 Tax=Candidatus Cytomitobacter primus TaxID=2066024 RepID=A0A5C0UH05_9PROT|nr:hypothetical protein [Candidatus Cytomitobacter primus]QEK38314.1 hypothetical protein FZC34_00015 [Candidatus Cytomitobacter primus]